MLNTKLYRPPVTSDLVIRSSLIKKLNDNIHLPLTLVVAPAGYGKSVLVSSWLEEWDKPSAWLSLDDEINSTRNFLTYFVAAIQKMFPGQFGPFQEMLKASELPDIGLFASQLINQLDSMEEEFVLVLDDYYSIVASDIHDFINTLLEYPPQNMHFVIITRVDPPLKINKLKSYCRILEIRMEDLSFSAEETAQLFNKQHIELKKTTLDALLMKTEGWVVGLRLAALSSSNDEDVKAMLKDQSDNQWMLANYLLEDLLSKKPEKFVRMLLISSLVNSFSADLLDAMQLHDKKEASTISGADFIEFIKKSNLFTIDLDSHNKWFRFHHLFNDMLRSKAVLYFSSSELKSFHLRASEWYEKQDQIERAIDHSLKANASERAMDLIVASKAWMINCDQFDLFHTWSKKIPDHILNQRPEMVLLKCWSLRMNQEIQLIIENLEIVEAYHKIKGLNKVLLAELNSFRGILHFYNNELDQCRVVMYEAITHFPDTFEVAIGEFELYYSWVSFMLGEEDEALSYLEVSIRESLAKNQLGRAMRLYGAQAFIHITNADLDKAHIAANQLYSITRGSRDLYLISWCNFFLALVHWHRNSFEEATKLLHEILTDDHMSNKRAMIDCYSMLTHYYIAIGQPGKAQAYCDTLGDYVKNSPTLSHRMAHVSCSQFFSSERVIDNHNSILAELPPTMEEMLIWRYTPLTCHIKNLIADGNTDALQLAAKNLEELHEFASAIHNRIRIIEINLLFSVVRHLQSDLKASRKHMEQALKDAMPGRVLCFFLEESAIVAEILVEFKNHPELGEFVKELIDNIKNLSKHRTTSPSIKNLEHKQKSRWDPEVSLTIREQEILQLVDKGLRNKEIAMRLYVSVDTVKKHLYNMFQKMHVHSRVNLMSRARELNLLATEQAGN